MVVIYLINGLLPIVTSKCQPSIAHLLVNDRLSPSHDGIRTVAHRDVQYDSLKKYGLVVTCLLCFVFRCFQGWQSSYEMELTPLQKKACQSLQDALAAQQRADEPEDALWSLTEGDTFASFKDNGLEDLDEEEHEDLDENEPECMEHQSDLTENHVQRCILDLLVSLFTHLPLGSDDKFYSPILRFVVLSSLGKNGQWLAGRRITQLFAALLFCGREVMMALMHNEVVRSSSLRYSE